MPGLDPLYYNANYRLLFQHKLLWWRSVANQFVGPYIAMLTLRVLLLHLWLSGPNFADLRVPDTLNVLLAVVNKVMWTLVFRDAHRFLRFHRPSNGYRWAVYVISAANTIPIFILHIQITILTSKTKILSPLRSVNLVLLLLFLC